MEMNWRRRFWRVVEMTGIGCLPLRLQTQTMLLDNMEGPA
jgi:hypothetical protein